MRKRTVGWSMLLGALMAAGCTGIVNDPGGAERQGPTARVPEIPPDLTRPQTIATCDESYEPVAMTSYAGRIKNLLAGQALTDEELIAVVGDPNSLGDFIDAWLSDPQATPKLHAFFRTAFQQEGFEKSDLTNQWGEGQRLGVIPGTDGTRSEDALAANFADSFGHTAVDLVERGRPFHEVASTEQFMMTTAMLAVMAFHDERVIDDAEEVRYRTLLDEIPSVTYTTDVIDTADSLDPTSPNFTRFTYLDLTEWPACAGSEQVDTRDRRPLSVLRAMLGYHGTVRIDGCQSGIQRGDAILTKADFTDWRLVTVRRPAAGERTTRFYDLPGLRSADELVVHTPRVGFFTTPAFFAVWPTNDANSARVTLNQTLIVAFNHSIDPSDLILPALEDQLDAEHAGPGTACYGCHIRLDPMRQFFRNEYSYWYSQQEDDSVAIQADFHFLGVEATGSTMQDLGRIIAEHPRFAPAWVQKLCFYATSAACPEDNPEFERVVAAFEDSGFDFRVLVRETLSSPLVTGAQCVVGGGGNLAGIARMRHFCATLSNRLGMTDACGMALVWKDEDPRFRRRNAFRLAGTIPNDTFSRGAQDPLTLSDVNLFVRGTYERICERTADDVVGSDRMFPASEPEVVIPQLVERLMGLPPSDPRHSQAVSILEEHYEDAREAANAGDSMRSTFTAACLSPSVIGMGL